jgi:uncharacterized protein (TIGR03437 family)
VLFDGVPSPLLFVRTDQINAVIPYEMWNHPVADVQIEYNGQQLEAGHFTIREAAPAIFRYGATNRAVALNQDGTLNSPDNPAALGSVITFWATGMGYYRAGSNINGLIFGLTPVPLARKVAASLGISSQLPAATVEYAGSAPGFVAGVEQINLLLPVTLPDPDFVTESLLAVPVDIQMAEYYLIDTVVISVK